MTTGELLGWGRTADGSAIDEHWVPHRYRDAVDAVTEAQVAQAVPASLLTRRTPASGLGGVDSACFVEARSSRAADPALTGRDPLVLDGPRPKRARRPAAVEDLPDAELPRTITRRVWP